MSRTSPLQRFWREFCLATSHTLLLIASLPTPSKWRETELRCNQEADALLRELY